MDKNIFPFEIVAVDGFVKYYAVVPAVLTETVKQAILTFLTQQLDWKRRKSRIFLVETVWMIVRVREISIMLKISISGGELSDEEKKLSIQF